MSCKRIGRATMAAPSGAQGAALCAAILGPSGAPQPREQRAAVRHAGRLTALGRSEIEVIDDDLGRSAFVMARGLMSCGGSVTELYRRVGVSPGRILKRAAGRSAGAAGHEGRGS